MTARLEKKETGAPAWETTTGMHGPYYPPPLYTLDPYAQPPPPPPPYGAYPQPVYWPQPPPQAWMPPRGAGAGASSAIDAADDAEQRARDVGGLFAKLHASFVAELRHLRRVRPNARQVTPLVGLLQHMSPSVFGTISSGAASVRVFTFHDGLGEPPSAAGVLRELHRALQFLIGQVAENIHHTHMHAMNAGLRIFRNMLHFYARHVIGEHGIDEYDRAPDWPAGGGPGGPGGPGGLAGLFDEACNALDAVERALTQDQKAKATAQLEAARKALDALKADVSP